MSAPLRILCCASLAFLTACSDSPPRDDTRDHARVDVKANADQKGKGKNKDRGNQVQVSTASGFYDAPLSLRLSHPDPDATIYYSLDGSDPDPANTQGTPYRYKNQYSYRLSDGFGDFIEGSYRTMRYEKPIRIADRSSEPDRFNQINTTLQSGLPRYFPSAPPLKGWKQTLNRGIDFVNSGIGQINGWADSLAGNRSPTLPLLRDFSPERPSELLKATVIRATAFKDGHALGEVQTATYFVMPRSTFDLPVISVVAQEDRLFGYDEGILVAGIAHDQFRMDNPDQQRAMGNAPANWARRGVEVPAHFQFFSNEHQPDHASVDQAVGLRVHGGVNRAAPSKALRIYARKEYGASSLQHAFFGEQQKYKRLILRNSGNDFYGTYLRDAVVQQIMTGLRFDTQAYRPAVVFLNGEYWGLLNLREYYSKHYLARVYKVDEERLDIMDLDQADEGDDTHWRDLMSYLESHPLQDDRHFAHVASKVDIDNFVDYHIANIFAVNYDWPHNNVRYWRAKIDQAEPDAPAGHDGRWRWLMFDLDVSFRRFDVDSLRRLASQDDGKDPRNRAWSSYLFRQLLQNAGFKERFISRFADTLNSTFVPERMTTIIEATRTGIATEIPRHISRWKTPASVEDWNKGVDHLVRFAQERPAVQRTQLARYFGLDEPYRLSVDVSNIDHGKVRVNTLTLDDSLPGAQPAVYPWTGFYFSEIPVEVEALPHTCFAFSHWEGDPRASQSIVLQGSSDTSLQAVFRRTCDTG